MITIEAIKKRVLPGWKLTIKKSDGCMLRRHDGLLVIVSDAQELDYRIWRHVSCSRKSRLPSWEDLAAVKHLFIGDEQPAYQVLPDKAAWINIHPYCLHLFATVVAGENPMPDFTHGGDTI